MLVGIGIAIRNPLLTLRSHAQEIVVFAAAPDRVGIAQPEWRGIRARRQVDVKVGLQRSQFADQVNRCREIAVEVAARNDAIRVPRAIELELVHAILAHEAHASVAESRVILGAGERKAFVYDFVSRASPLRPRVAVWACRSLPTETATRPARCRTEAAVCFSLVNPFGKPELNCHSVAGSSHPSSKRNDAMGTPRFFVSSVPNVLMTLSAPASSYLLKYPRSYHEL